MVDGTTTPGWSIKLVEAHWQEMEKKGLLPKGEVMGP